MVGCNVLAALVLCIVTVLGQHGHNHGHQHGHLYTHHARQASGANVLVIMTDDQGKSASQARGLSWSNFGQINFSIHCQ